MNDDTTRATPAELMEYRDRPKTALLQIRVGAKQRALIAELTAQECRMLLVNAALAKRKKVR